MKQRRGKRVAVDSSIVEEEEKLSNDVSDGDSNSSSNNNRTEDDGDNEESENDEHVDYGNFIGDYNMNVDANNFIDNNVTDSSEDDDARQRKREVETRMATAAVAEIDNDDDEDTGDERCKISIDNLKTKKSKQTTREMIVSSKRKKNLRYSRCLTFSIAKEGHTLGNVLRSLLMKQVAVEFAGYALPHPMEDKMLLRVQTFGKEVEAERKAAASGRISAEDGTTATLETMGNNALSALICALNDLEGICDHLLYTYQQEEQQQQLQLKSRSASQH